jgi:hypothetical protein
MWVGGWVCVWCVGVEVSDAICMFPLCCPNTPPPHTHPMLSSPLYQRSPTMACMPEVTYPCLHHAGSRKRKRSRGTDDPIQRRSHRQILLREGVVSESHANSTSDSMKRHTV